MAPAHLVTFFDQPLRDQSLGLREDLDLDLRLEIGRVAQQGLDVSPGQLGNLDRDGLFLVLVLAFLTVLVVVGALGGLAGLAVVGVLGRLGRVALFPVGRGAGST